MTIEVEHLFIYLLVTWLFSSVNYLVEFLLGFVLKKLIDFYLLIYMSSLYFWGKIFLLAINTYSKYLLPLCVCLFVLLVVSFDNLKFLILM